MALSEIRKKIAKEEVVTTVAIELERLFTVVSNQYRRADNPVYSHVIHEVETELKTALKEAVKKPIPFQ